MASRQSFNDFIRNNFVPLRWSKTLLVNIIACGGLSVLGAIVSGPGGSFATLGLYILGVAIAVIISGKGEWIGIRNRNGGVGIIALSLLMISGGVTHCRIRVMTIQRPRPPLSKK